jgi:hypothetical protein
VLIEDATGDMVNVNRARALIEEAIDAAAPEALSPSALSLSGGGTLPHPKPKLPAAGRLPFSPLPSFFIAM